jgi:hypothetical protein
MRGGKYRDSPRKDRWVGSAHCGIDAKEETTSERVKLAKNVGKAA